MYRIVADSSCDFASYPEIDFKSVPLTLSTAEREFTDDCNLNVREMMDYMTSYKGRSQTACPSVDSWLEAFEGAEELYVLTITSGLSGTYNSACLAANQFLENHPGAKVRVFDTKSTGPEMRLLMEKIVELKSQDKSFTEVCKEADAYLSTTRLFFSFQSLHNLAQNGRVNKVLASALGMLHISILGTATPEGVIEPIGKSRGENALIRSFVKEIEKAGYQGGKIRICHADNEALAQNVTSALREKYPNLDAFIYPAGGLCSFYVENGGIILGCEC